MHQSENKIIIAICVITLVMLFAIALFVFLVIHSRKKYNQYNYDKQVLQQKLAHTLLQTQLEIKEQTMEYISRELHDNISQVASLIKINLNTLKLTPDSPIAEKLEDSKELLRRLITDIKLLSRSLSSDTFASIGLFKSIENDIQRIDRTDNFTAIFISYGNIPDPPADKAIILYRMAQEILNNIVKHSNASHIECAVNYLQNNLILAFRDDGDGFKPETMKHGGGAGLRNLEQRAKLIGAQLTIDSKPGVGTTTSILLSIK